MNSIEFPEMNYKHFREKSAKFHIFLLLSIMGGISLITIYDRKFRHNRPEEGLPKMITYISPINMVAEDNHLYFAYKSPLGSKIWSYACVIYYKRILFKLLNQLDLLMNYNFQYKLTIISYICLLFYKVIMVLLPVTSNFFQCFNKIPFLAACQFPLTNDHSSN